MRYSEIIKQKAGILFGIIFLFTSLGFLYAYLIPQTYKVTISFDIKRVVQTRSDDYRYDGYYAISASGLFADNVMSWMKTPPFVAFIFDTAQISSKDISLPQFFKVRKYAPQNVIVFFSYSKEQEASNLAYTLIEQIEIKSKEILVGEFGEPLFFVEASQVDISPYRPSVQFWTVLGLLVGIMWCVIFIYMQSYGYRD